jgi:hypothetical protein
MVPIISWERKDKNMYVFIYLNWNVNKNYNYYLNLYNVFELLFWYVLCVMLILW